MNKILEHQFDVKDYEIVKREVLYKGVFTLARYHIKHRLFNGGWSDIFIREVLERFSAAAVLPYDPVQDRVILIEQFRPGATNNSISPWQIEIPAGILDQDEKPLEVAIREAEEEAGCVVSKLELIQEYFVSPGGSNEYIHIYCGIVNSSGVNGVHGLKYEHENIRVMNISADEAFAKMRHLEIKTSPAIISLQWLALNRDRLRKNLDV